MLAIPLCLDALFGHFKQVNQQDASQIQLLKPWMACSNIMEITPNIRLCVKLVGYLKNVHS